MNDRTDVELRCDGCGDETVATEDCYQIACSQCSQGRRRVVQRHPGGYVEPRADAITIVFDVTLAGLDASRARLLHHAALEPQERRRWWLLRADAVVGTIGGVVLAVGFVLAGDR